MLWIRNATNKPKLNAMNKLMGGFCEGNTTSFDGMDRNQEIFSP